MDTLSENAIYFFGTTEDSRKAGFILPEGALLNFATCSSDRRNLSHGLAAWVHPQHSALAAVLDGWLQVDVQGDTVHILVRQDTVTQAQVLTLIEKVKPQVAAWEIDYLDAEGEHLRQRKLERPCQFDLQDEFGVQVY